RQPARPGHHRTPVAPVRRRGGGSVVNVATRVLIVDDDASVARVLGAGLCEAEIASEAVASAEAALAAPERRAFAPLPSDPRMPGASGVDLLAQLRQRWPEIPVVLLTAHGTVGMAVQAMKSGALDFLTKPFDLDEVVAVVRRALAVAARQSSAPPAPGSALLG